MHRAATIVLGLVALGSCTPQLDTPPVGEGPVIAAPTTGIGPQVTRSNAIPTMAELLDIGLTVEEAECFIAEIDPDKTGVLHDPELFMVAFTACLGGAGGAP